MAFNAFTAVKLSDDGKTVLVKGKSTEDYDAQRIEVAVIDVNDEDRRLQGPADDPEKPEWEATLLNEPDGKPPFKDGDTVVVAGAATSEKDGFELWAGVSEDDLLTPKIDLVQKPQL